MEKEKMKVPSITFYFKEESGQQYIFMEQEISALSEGYMAAAELHAIVKNMDGTKRTYPIFQQKAQNYGEYSEYMTRHGCACCSLTTLLRAFCPENYPHLRPDGTICQVEKACFPEEIWKKNYGKSIARQMPVSLYGISVILGKAGIKHRYVGSFQDDRALAQMKQHLYRGKPIVIETSRIRRKNGRIAALFDKKYAGSYHTMIILGIDKDGFAVFTDSATRAWAGERQRLKWAKLEELIHYLFPQKNEKDTHVYFNRRKNTGGYILVESQENT